MLAKIGLGLLCAISCFSTPLYSMQTHVLQPGISIEFDLPYNEPQQFVNYLFWSVQANCVVSSKDPNLSFQVETLSKKITINQLELTSGKSTLINLHNGEIIRLQADAGAKAKLTNLQPNLVHAVCNSI